MTAEREMPRYKCHKEVHALKIAAVSIHRDGSATIDPADAGFAEFETSAGWGERFKGDENDLGYFVAYGDGYASWSPTKAFEEGYERV